MSNQVYRNAYNGGNKYMPDVTKNVYQIQADATAPNTNYGVSWTAIRWDKLNGANVGSTVNAGITTYLYTPAPATVNEIAPSSISNVSGGETLFYVRENGNYHIEFTLVFTDVVGTNFLGIQISTYNPITLAWDIDPILRGVTSGLQAAAGNPLMVTSCVDLYLSSNQRFKAAYQVSNSVGVIANNAGLGPSKLIISKNY